MSSVITGILSSTVGFLLGKARDRTANKLEERGDVADEKLRGLIVQDLTDIKSKLDALSIKDLDASCSFLKEGVELLNAALDKPSEVEKRNEGSSEVATKVQNDTASAILNTTLTLPGEMQRLQVLSDPNYISAKDCFKACRERATDAFNNKSLSIKDRIMACKLRVAARILESGLETPQVATTACMTALEELQHCLAAVQEVFQVFLNQGLKSKYKKSERLESIMSVLIINHTLYDFACKYCSQHPNPFSWPQIELKDRPFHPVIDVCEILINTSSPIELSKQLNRAVIIDSSLTQNWTDFAVNSRGEIIILHYNKITLINSTGERKVAELLDKEDSDCFKKKGRTIAVDSEDNIYAVRYPTQIDKNCHNNDFVLNVFDKNLNKKHGCELDFFHASKDDIFIFLTIAVDKQHNLIMATYRNDEVYVCDNMGQLKSKFKRDGDRWWPRLSISNNNDVIIGSHYGDVVHVYSTEGELKTKVKLPRDHRVRGVAFHHGICKMIVLSCVETRDSRSRFLLSYSETGEEENSMFLCQNTWSVNIKSHVSGTFVIRTENILTFI